MLAWALLLQALPVADGWMDRAALGADRLAVAAVDEQARTRPMKQLWWSGEGQQVLELLDHRACLGNLAQGCLQGVGLPPKSKRPRMVRVQERKRWDWSDSGHQVMAFEIVGTKAVLWTWRPASTHGTAAALPLPVTKPLSAGQPISPDPAPWRAPGWLWGGLLLVAFLAGRLWARRRQRTSKDWKGVAEGLEEELERERLRAAVAQGQAARERDALRLELSQATPQHSEEDRRQIAQLEDRLQRVRQRWRHQRTHLGREAEVSQRDMARFLAPLQQLGAMLRQVERRMRAVDETDFAHKIQQRRLGLQAFESRLRQHFSVTVILDERSWNACCDELDELLAVEDLHLGQSAQEQAPNPTSKARALQVLRGGR